MAFYAELTPPPLRRTLDATMTAGFAMGKELVRSLPREAETFTWDFRANEKFHLSPVFRCDGLDRCPSLAGVIDFQPSTFSLRHCLFGALTPAEIKIVEGAAKS